MSEKEFAGRVTLIEGSVTGLQEVVPCTIFQDYAIGQTQIGIDPEPWI